ncbi:uncharacterized protein METZ01_LOCUS511466, partial [marine metagenome]
MNFDTSIDISFGLTAYKFASEELHIFALNKLKLSLLHNFIANSALVILFIQPTLNTPIFFFIQQSLIIL